jgi:hypothetical protein
VNVGRELPTLEGASRGVRALALSPDGKTLASGSSDGTVLLWEGLPTRWEPWRVRRLTAEQKRAAWEDLAHRDAARAYRAAALLLRDPEGAGGLLREHLRPVVTKADDRLVAGMIARLDSDDFDVREEARLELEGLADQAEAALRRALESGPPLEQRRRIERLLARLDAAATAPEVLRPSRAVAVLARLGTPEARELLRRLSKGAPEAALTRQARAALRRARE